MIVIYMHGCTISWQLISSLLVTKMYVLRNDHYYRVFGVTREQIFQSFPTRYIYCPIMNESLFNVANSNTHYLFIFTTEKNK